MAIVNGTFDANLNGWNVYTEGNADVIWDNGKARLRIYRCSYVRMEQTFLIDENVLSFNSEYGVIDPCATSYCYSGVIKYRLLLDDGTVIIDQTAPFIDPRIIVGGSYAPLNYIFKDIRTYHLDKYIGRNATLIFEIYPYHLCNASYISSTYLWIDNVTLTSRVPTLGITNGTFGTDLNGWDINIYPLHGWKPVWGSVEWDNGRAKLTAQLCAQVITGQMFVINRDTLTFDYEIHVFAEALSKKNCYGQECRYRITLDDGTVIKEEILRQYQCTPVVGSKTVSLSNYVGRVAYISFYITEGQSCTMTTSVYTYMWIDNVKLTGSNIIPIDIIPSVTTCIQPCDANIDVTWQNTGELSGTFEPTISVNDIPIKLSAITLNPGDTAPTTFVLTGLTEGVNTICAESATERLCTTIDVIAKGTLDISSTPQGAAIILNGTDTGKITPATIPNITAGAHTITLRLNGYRERIETIQIIAGQTTTISVTLEPLTGTLDISSTPQGAAIILNGTDTGKITPATIPNLTAGAHTITLRLNGYREYIETIQIIAGQTTTISVTLEPLTGNISFTSTPIGAKIYIDEKDTGLFTPVIVSNLTTGLHTYRLSKFAYFDSIGTIEVIPDTTVSIFMAMTPMKTTCQLFNSVPIGSKIIIDGWDLGVVTPINLCEIPYGYHYYELLGTFTIEEKGRPFQPFVTVPKGARIYIDGVYMGETPDVIKDLSPGTYKYRLIGTITLK